MWRGGGSKGVKARGRGEERRGSRGGEREEQWREGEHWTVRIDA